MRRSYAFAAFACLAATASAGDAMVRDAMVRVADAAVRFERERWRASVINEGIRFEPQGESSKLDDVELRVREDARCHELAVQAFQFGHYDTGSLQATPIAIGGITGERFAAHTGCRNATPRGVVACVKHGGRAYLLTSLNAGCEGRNLFSGIDPIAEIADGMSFTPR
jgi:hypothetical protein